MSAAATDEGGNFIDVHYGPLTTGNSDYHLTATDTVAINKGNPANPAVPNLVADIDGNERIGVYDIGADEYATGQGNIAPRIVPDPVTLRVLLGSALQYRIPAIDPNPGSNLTYAITGVLVQQAGAGQSRRIVPVAGPGYVAPVIDPASGVITWTAQAIPAFSGNNNSNCGNYNTRRRYQHPGIGLGWHGRHAGDGECRCLPPCQWQCHGRQRQL